MAELLDLYWLTGRDIVDCQEHAGWGAKMVDRIARDLHATFPDQRGWSRSNPHYVRTVATARPSQDYVQQPVARLPWGHITVMLGRLKDQELRDWYAAAATEQAWSRNVLEHQIATRLHQRLGAASSNFTAQLPPVDPTSPSC